jgi:hypothetical protein
MIRRNDEKKRIPLQKNTEYSKRCIAMVWTAVTTTVMLGFAAFSVDMGYTYLAQTELQCSADAAAMAAASQLSNIDDSSNATILAVAKEYAGKNKVVGISPTLDESDIVFGHATMESDGKTTFEEGVQPYDAVKVTVRMTNDSPNGSIKLFFAKILGVEDVELKASAIAMLVPRDIAIVIDLSRSMNYDSQLRHESTGINIQEVWQDLGSPTFGKMTTFTSGTSGMIYNTSSDVTKVIQALGLSSVPYPYPKGSWSEYVKYVQGYSVNNGPAITSTTDSKPYKYYYGLRTFVNYLLSSRTLVSETPKLADTRTQPLYAVKQAVECLCNYLLLMDSGDHMSLHSYGDDSTAEQQHQTLTGDYTLIIQGVYEQQAGGYGPNTNISAGIQAGMNELLSSRARSNAKKVIFLLTDGEANRPTNETYGKQAAINAAYAAEDKNIQIYTISLGSESDQTIMMNIAEIGHGVHYHVPILDIKQCEEDLKKVFKTLGGKRPVRLIG